MTELKKTTTLRPCLVEGKKALFHEWVRHSDVIEPSPMRGGHPGGTVAYTLGLIEYEDGTVAETVPHKIKFIDSIMEE